MILVSLASGSGVSFRSDDQCFDKFARQPDDALIFGLNARRRLQHKPRDIDGQPSTRTSARSMLSRARKDSFCHIAFIR